MYGRRSESKLGGRSQEGKSGLWVLTGQMFQGSHSISLFLGK